MQHLSITFVLYFLLALLFITWVFSYGYLLLFLRLCMQLCFLALDKRAVIFYVMYLY